MKAKSVFDEYKKQEIKAKKKAKLIEISAFRVFNKTSLLKNLAQKFKDEDKVVYSKEEKKYLMEEVNKMLEDTKLDFAKILDEK